MTQVSPLPSRRLALAAFLSCLALAATGARAGEGEDKDAGAPAVRLATVGIPVMENNQVVNYLFLSIKINLTMTAPEGKFRDMEPYFRDALVKAAHRTSFGVAGHSDQLDEARFKSVMMGEWSKITGPNMIKSIDILSQNPKRHLG